MKKLFILALTALTFACNHIDQQVTPSSTNNNTIIGSWTVQHWINYEQRNTLSPIDSSFWVATTTDTMNFNGNLNYRLFTKYIFNNDMTYKAEWMHQGMYDTLYGKYLIIGDTIKMMENGMGTLSTSTPGAKLTINNNSMYLTNEYTNSPKNGYEMKLKRNY